MTSKATGESNPIMTETPSQRERGRAVHTGYAEVLSNITGNIKTQHGLVPLRSFKARPRDKEEITLFKDAEAEAWSQPINYSDDYTNQLRKELGRAARNDDRIKTRSSALMTLQDLQSRGDMKNQFPITVEKKAKIEKGWIKAHLKTEQQQTAHYAQCCLQAMGLAATAIGIQECYRGVNPDTGRPYSAELAGGDSRAQERKIQELQLKFDGLKDGTGPPLVSMSQRQRLKTTAADDSIVLEKHLLHKRSKKFSQDRTRYFNIKDGRLNVFRYLHKKRQTKKEYKLEDLDTTEETKGSAKDLQYKDCKLQVREKCKGAMEPFIHDTKYTCRVEVKCKERQSRPVYLYATSLEQATKWVRAIKMSKYLSDPHDEQAMRFVIGKTVASRAVKGYHAMHAYFKEMVTLRENLERFQMRFEKAELSRAWNKASMVFQTRVQRKEKRKAQQEYAAKFLAQKVSRLSGQAARSLNLVRSGMITTVQAKFRHYRRDKIANRAYALGSSAQSRLKQAQSGMPMECAFVSMSYHECLSLAFAGSEEALKKLDEAPDLLRTRKATYSEVNIPVKLSTVAVSDTVTMLTFTPVAEGFDHSHLATSKWAEFINLDQISSIVLNTERMLATNSEGGQEIGLSQMGGMWMTINGPRVGWCQRMHSEFNLETKQIVTKPVGVKDGTAMLTDLLSPSRGAGLQWFTLKVTVGEVIIPKVPDPLAKKKDKEASMQDNAPAQTFMVCHILGRSFKTAGKGLGENPQYNDTFEVEIPLGTATQPVEDCLAGIDFCTIALEIMTAADPPTTLWAGTMPLWKVFAPDRIDRSPDGKEIVMSLAKTLTRASERPGADGKETMTFQPTSLKKTCYLVHPTEEELSQLQFGTVALQVEARAANRNNANNDCISPEIQGCGLSTSLYSTHRGAWFNPSLNTTVFNSSNVPNFVELKLSSLTFPEAEARGQERLCKYYIEAKCNGVSACSPLICRPRTDWGNVFPTAIPGKLIFKGVQVFVPLPPGAFAQKENVKVEVAVIEQVDAAPDAIAFSDIINQRYGRPRDMAGSPVYHACLILNVQAGFGVDQLKHINLNMTNAKQTRNDVEVPAGSSQSDVDVSKCAKLDVDVSLRDRDYVCMTECAMYKNWEQRDDYRLSQRALFVGDGAMLLAEEPLTYPKTAQEFRKKMCPGEFGKDQNQQGRGLKLREPCLSHEFSLSGMSGIPGQQFKQKNIPSQYPDVLPYKYVFPSSEQEFIEEGRSGVFWRIMDDLAKQPAETKQKKRVVEYLTHVVKHIPVIVLAVYANRTCDVEIAPSFVQEWQKDPQKKYSLAGEVMVKRIAPQAVKGDAAKNQQQQSQYRVILKAVPLSATKAVHAASFNVYDARFKNVDDGLSQFLNGMQKNDHNPRDISEPNSGPQGDRRGAYHIHAGPLPIDARANCQYEWSLHMHAKSDEDAFHFLTMIRQCTRMNHFQQVLRLKEAMNKPTENRAVQYNTGPRKTTHSGYLEVVLVEARRLAETRVQKHKDYQQMITHAVQMEPNTLVQFSVTGEGHPHAYHEEEVEIGQSLLVTAHGWDPHKNFFAVSLKTTSGSTAFRLAISMPTEDKAGKSTPGKISRSSQVAKQSLKEAEKQVEFSKALKATFRAPVKANHQNPFKDHPFAVRFQLTQTKWEVSIGGRRFEDLDFEHKPPLGEEKVVKVEPEGLIRCKVSLLKEREVLAVKGSKVQRSPVVGPSVSPNWAKRDGLQGTGGWVFKTPEIDPLLNPSFEFEMVLFNKNSFTGMLTEIGRIDQHICGAPSESGSIEIGGSQLINLCDKDRPFHNMWVPLYCKDPTAGTNMKPNSSGEVHIMTRWVPNLQDVMRVLPKTCGEYVMRELRPKISSAQFRNQRYDIEERLQGYNPNLSQSEYPESKSDYLAMQAKEMYNTVPYLECCETRQKQMWRDFLKAEVTEEADKKMCLGLLRDKWLNSTAQTDQAKLYSLDEQVRRGIPSAWRLSQTISIWSELTKASEVQTQIVANLKTTPELAYLSLVEYGSRSSMKSHEVMLQLQEDVYALQHWESSKYPDTMEKHLARLKRAQNICIALIALTYKIGPKGKPDKGAGEMEIARADIEDLSKTDAKYRGVAYCQSLLVLAFTLMLPQNESQTMDGRRSATSDTPDPKKTYDRDSFLEYKAQEESKKPVFKPDPVKFELKEYQEESRVFWLLFTLIGAPQNQEYADYFGSLPDNIPRRRNVMKDKTIVPAQSFEDPTSSDVTSFVDHPGAMKDIYLLDCIMARNMPEVWIHLHSVGFHLSSVFYGAFMRWFAFYLPLPSVYRLWDLLFAESTRLTFNDTQDPRIDRGLRVSTTKKPARHVLIDMAYAVIKKCSTQLTAVASGMEARACMVNCMEGLHDPSTVIEMIADAERDLWETLLSEHLNRPPVFLNDFKQADEWYQKAYTMTWVQNQVLATVKEKMRFAPGARGAQQQQRGNQPQNQGQQNQRVPMTTERVEVYFIHRIQHEMQRHREATKYGGFWRPLPHHIYEAGPILNKTIKDQFWHFVGAASDMIGVGTQEMMRIKPKPMPAIPNIMGEPLFDEKKLRDYCHDKGTDWQTEISNIYESFSKPQDIGKDGSTEDSRMSIIEFLVALICCTQGTIGEKVLALFHLYGQIEKKQWKMKHNVPILHHTKALVQRVADDEEKMMKKVDPDVDEKEKPALLFTVRAIRTKDQRHRKQPGDEIGQVYVPTLHPYTVAGMSRPEAENFIIFAPKNAQAGGPPGMGGGGNKAKRRRIGELNMGICWIPSDSHPDVGQLCISVHHLKFDMKGADTRAKSPSVEICTFDDRDQPVPIQRWDTRDQKRKVASTITFGLAFGGALGGTMHWEETEYIKLGGGFTPADHEVTGHGWDSATESFKWNPKWGEQCSKEDMKFSAKFTGSRDMAPGLNCISIKACRLITLAVLRRSLVFMTNRQAMLIADAAFNRCNAIPGIIEAVICQGTEGGTGRIPDEYKTAKQLMEDYKKKGQAFLDVKHHLLIEHERQVNENCGEMDMWADAAENHNKVSLEGDLKIPDPFKQKNKWLWIRYVRAGDGERKEVQWEVDADGTFKRERIEFDMSQSLDKAQAQMNITKEEFVACFQEHPLLSESLRQICSRCVRTRDDNLLPKYQPMKLKVTIADPNRHIEEEDAFDMRNVRKKVLLEIWDHDKLGDDFLGECWLKPLDQLERTVTQCVMQVGNADESTTRPDPKKMKHKEGIHATGTLIVRAGWVMKTEKDPAKVKEMNAKLVDESLDPFERTKLKLELEELKHTGILTIHVVKAEKLRASDVSRSAFGKKKESSDPYVCAYVLNEATGKWHKEGTHHVMEPYIFKTKHVNGTVNPEWKEEKERTFELQTGTWEKKTAHHGFFGHHFQGVTEQQKREHFAKFAASVFESDEKIEVHFGSDDKKQVGARHGVEVYLNDTILQFKNKLRIACVKEAQELERTTGSEKEKSVKLASKYKGLKLSMKTLVTVYVPSSKTQRLHNVGGRRTSHEQRDYQMQQNLELDDPMYWQPLDPIRAFSDYSTYGFSGQPSPGQDVPLLHISEATEQYKMRNPRYRHFEEELLSGTKRLEDTDTDKMCFGYGKYTHEEDRKSTEWRPVYVHRSDQSGGEGKPRTYNVEWLYAFGYKDGSGSGEKEAELGEESVLLGPRDAHILGSGHLSHQKYLDKAPDMRATERLSDLEIAEKLNKELLAQYELDKQMEQSASDKSVGKPPLITSFEVKQYLKKREFDEGKSSPPTQPTSASSPQSAAVDSSPPTNVEAQQTGTLGGGVFGGGGMFGQTSSAGRFGEPSNFTQAFAGLGGQRG